jgi:hypothetical protein
MTEDPMFQKIIFLSLLLASAAWSLAQSQINWNEPLNLNVNNSIVQCEGTPSQHFWLCQGTHFSGFIERYSEDTNKFFPFFTNAEQQIIELELSITILGTQKRLNFSDFDYFGINLQTVLNSLLKSCTQNSSKLDQFIERFGVFIDLFFKYKLSLKNIAIEQKIECIDGIFSSRFTKMMGKKEDHENDATIPQFMASPLSEEEQKFYDSFRPSSCRAPDLLEAEKLFKTISERKDISFSYTDDGCFARTHLIATELFEQGLSTGKIWIAGDLKNPHQPTKQWYYHVATLIYVQTDNEIEMRVIDPSPTVTRLLTVDEWLQQNMVSHPKKVTYPLPLYGHFYEDYLIAISSHRPLLPFKADIHRSEEDLLKQAHDRNQVYQRLLK